MVNRLQALKVIALLVVMLPLWSGCGRTILNETDYLKWLFSDDQRIVKKHEVNGIEIAARYLPEEYRELRAQRANLTLREKDTTEVKTIAFLLSYKWDQAGNLMMNDIQDYEEYKVRLSDISFNLEQYVKLECNGTQYPPLLTHYEHNAGLSESQQVYLVFSVDATSKTDQLDLVLDDPLFRTGIHRLKFDAQELQELPRLKKPNPTSHT